MRAELQGEKEEGKGGRDGSRGGCEGSRKREAYLLRRGSGGRNELSRARRADEGHRDEPPCERRGEKAVDLT